MKKGVGSKFNNLRNIIAIVVIVLIALLVFSILYSSLKKSSFSKSGEVSSYNPIAGYEQSQLNDLLSIYTSSNEEPNCQILLGEKECTANGKKICCPQGFNCGTDNSGNPICESPCTDSNNPVSCPTKQGMQCCPKDTICSYDYNGDLSCQPTVKKCVKPDYIYCGLDSDGAPFCCPPGNSCAQTNEGNAACCPPGTYPDPVTNICVGMELTKCGTNPWDYYICPGANLVCCLDTKNCCPQNTECCESGCCPIQNAIT